MCEVLTDFPLSANGVKHPCPTFLWENTQDYYIIYEYYYYSSMFVIQQRAE